MLTSSHCNQEGPFPTKKTCLVCTMWSHLQQTLRVDQTCHWCCRLWCRLLCRRRSTAASWSSASEGECPAPKEALEECPMCACSSDQHSDEHERNSAFRREFESACNAIQASSPELPPASVLPDLLAFVGIWRKSYKASARCTSMGEETTCTSENCKHTENDKVLNGHVSNRLCAREVESSDVQGTFVQVRAQPATVGGEHVRVCPRR